MLSLVVFLCLRKKKRIKEIRRFSRPFRPWIDMVWSIRAPKDWKTRSLPLGLAVKRFACIDRQKFFISDARGLLITFSQVGHNRLPLDLTTHLQWSVSMLLKRESESVRLRSDFIE
jgi:hypothetical protein